MRTHSQKIDMFSKVSACVSWETYNWLRAVRCVSSPLFPVMVPPKNTGAFSTRPLNCEAQGSSRSTAWRVEEGGASGRNHDSSPHGPPGSKHVESL